MASDDDRISLEITKQKPEYKKLKLMIFLFVFVIVLCILSAVTFGERVLGYTIFSAFFFLPITIIYSDEFLSFIPQNIASYFIDELQEIKNEIKVPEKQISFYNKEYIILFIGIGTYLLSCYILYKQKEKLIGIGMSTFLCILSSIIVNDIF